MPTYTPKQHQAYTAAYQTTENPMQCLVMLYDGVLKLLYQAKDAVTEGRIEDRYNLLARACHVIDGLHASVNPEKGGDVAKTLDRYYHQLFKNIQAVNRLNTQESVDKVIMDVKQMRDAWLDVQAQCEESAKGSKTKDASGLNIAL